MYDTENGLIHYQVNILDDNGKRTESTECMEAQAYGGYLDNEYRGFMLQQQAAHSGDLDVYGSYAVSSTLAITGAIRIHGNSTLWLEKQNSNPAIYGAIAVQSGTTDISNIALSSEDTHIGGVSGQSHGILGEVGTKVIVRDCNLSSQATGSVIGTYGSLRAENCTFRDGGTGIHFNGSFTSGSQEIRSVNCTFHDLDMGIQGGTLNGRKPMSLYMEGTNNSSRISKEAVSVTNGEYQYFQL